MAPAIVLLVAAFFTNTSLTCKWDGFDEKRVAGTELDAQSR